jgi:hypothetical protein
MLEELTSSRRYGALKEILHVGDLTAAILERPE